MKDLSGVNLCVWIEILSIIKNLVSLPFVLLYFCFDICLQWSCVFDTGVDGVADGSVDNYLEWVVLLGIN